MAEREDFVAWLETLTPALLTTHDVEVAWRAWEARSGRSSGRAWILSGARGADPKCVDLAVHFLPPQASDEFAYRLALHIQEQVEDWMECYEEANPPEQPKE